MRILHIYKDYYPPVIGGIEKHINLLSRKQADLGHNIKVLVSNTSNKIDVANIENIEVTKIPQWGRILSAPLNPNFSWWIRKLGNSCDILHFHLPNPTAVMGYLASGLKKPVVVTYHSDIVRQRRLSKIFTPFLKYFLNKYVDRIITTSPNIKRSSNILKYYNKKTHVIPLGIDTNLFSQGRNEQHIHHIKNKYGNNLIIFIGKFRYYKGLNVLLEAMRGINSKLILIGNGPYESELRQVVEQYSLNNKIIFMNEIQDNLLLDYIYASQILVLPSTLKSEAFGLVLLEAMACGKPVVSTNLGTGTSYVNLHRHTGLVVRPNSVYELENAIKYLLDNPHIRATFGKNAQKRVWNLFNAELMTLRTLEIYLSLQKSKRSINPVLKY